MIRTLEKGLQFGKPAKCIYIAPTKVCDFICSLQVTSALPLAGIMYGKISRLEYEIRTAWVQMWVFLRSTTPFIDCPTGSQLTGDTVVFGTSAWGDARNSSIMSVIWFCSRFDELTKDNRVTTVSNLIPSESTNTYLYSARNGIVLLGIGEGFILQSCIYCLTNLRNDYDQVLSQIELFLVDEVRLNFVSATITMILLTGSYSQRTSWEHFGGGNV